LDRRHWQRRDDWSLDRWHWRRGDGWSLDRWHWRWRDDRSLDRWDWRRRDDFDPRPRARGDGDVERLDGPCGAPLVSQRPQGFGRSQ